MVYTDDVILPSVEELKRDELPVTHNFLLSTAMWLGKYCDHQSKEFMLCRHEEGDPRKCIEYGHKLTDCGFEFLKKVKKTCKDECEWYTKCLDFSGREPNFFRCRNEQAIFDGCMYDSGFERAKYGDFQMIRVHDTDRPRPKKHVPIFTDAVEDSGHYSPNKEEVRAPNGTGGRLAWQTWFR